MSESVAPKALYESMLKGRLSESDEQTLLGNNLTNLIRVYLSCPGSSHGNQLSITWSSRNSSDVNGLKLFVLFQTRSKNELAFLKR